MNIIKPHRFITSLGSSLGTLAMTVAIIGPAPAFAAKFQGAPVAPAAGPPAAIVFTTRDFVSISGLNPDAELRVEAFRDNQVVGTADAKTDATGFAEVNHVGGFCWGGSITPDISPKDNIKVTYKATGNVATQTYTQNVMAFQAAVDGFAQGSTTVTDSTYVVIKGTAQSINGDAMDPALLEVRIINRDFIDPSNPTSSRIGKREIRADIKGGRIDDVNGKPVPDIRNNGKLATGFLKFDPIDDKTNPKGLNFTATFVGLSASEQILVTEGQTRVMGWASVDLAANRIGVTIYEVGAFGGPGFGGCPAGPGGVVAAKAPPNDLVYYDPEKLIDAKDVLQEAIVTVFPNRDFVSMSGYAPGTDLQVVVRRQSGNSTNPTPVIGTARGLANKRGVFEINHIGGACWAGQTPDIGPNDYIDVIKVGTNPLVGQRQRVINTQVKKAAFQDPNALKPNPQVFVTGFAVDENNTPLSMDFVEQRIINSDFTTTPIGRRDVTATATGGKIFGGSATLTGPVCSSISGCEWKATYNFDPAVPSEPIIATAGQSRAMAWLLNTTGGVRSGITIAEFDPLDQLGGPGMGNCPARGNDSIALPPAPPVTQ